ncbi:MAG: hypothetical protein UR53_C0004G0010 [Candidatus Magasanikbacteria bacterium GW2011_GWC2_34_16]|uniref:Uncharacterized protein n=2 Tax=Candidatus Magasanikiibacteriota TaxID=1752731 RepID=A0A0G0KF39_9BACT|nr:MAG: hypothetical protein UR53_C0004G0010 [Candidatus Magasanikbacteria bacterium GW2011_GWC2_34_16]KKQ39186.1 MAG: hypothetical protein US58_C0039G0005 [Candidatus Magasanikbacteria bacterium GW2011_GWA2_37_8]
MGGGASYEDVLVQLGVDRKLIYPVVRDCLMTGKFSYRTMVDFLFDHFQIIGCVSERRKATNCWERDNQSARWFTRATELVARLRQEGNNLVLVSNISTPAWDTVGAMLEINTKFDRLFLSFQEGMAKPNKQVWQTVESWFPQSKEFWMIGDNNDDDLVVPRAMGWQTRLVKNDGSDLLNLWRKK